jgi:beta-lactamase regulating signal transducer with metallopeptidase domain
MQFTFFSFVMSLLWFNLYIVAINTFRKKDNFIISFSTLPLIFFLFLSIFRLIFNFEIPGSRIIESRNIFPKAVDFIRRSLYSNGFNIKIFQVLIFIWIIGTIILLLSNITKYIKFKKTLEKLENHISEKNKNIFNEILKQKKLGNKIEIVQNDNISSPFILGILKGQIYIPNISFSKEELEYIILHEINHFLEMDSLKKILIQSIKYIFWWNPFAHLFANNFNHILEIQCDLETTAGFVDDEKIRYLESMTKIIKNSTNSITEHSSTPNLVSIKDVDSLKQRFRIVLNYKGKRNLFNVFNIGLCILALCLFIASYFIILQPYYNQNNDELYKEEDRNNSFIIEKSDGSYDIYINNVFKYSIKNLEDLNENLTDLPIY